MTVSMNELLRVVYTPVPSWRSIARSSLPGKPSRSHPLAGWFAVPLAVIAVYDQIRHTTVLILCGWTVSALAILSSLRAFRSPPRVSRLVVTPRA